MVAVKTQKTPSTSQSPLSDNDPPTQTGACPYPLKKRTRPSAPIPPPRLGTRVTSFPISPSLSHLPSLPLPTSSPFSPPSLPYT